MVSAPHIIFESPTHLCPSANNTCSSSSPTSLTLSHSVHGMKNSKLEDCVLCQQMHARGEQLLDKQLYVLTLNASLEHWGPTATFVTLPLTLHAVQGMWQSATPLASRMCLFINVVCLMSVGSSTERRMYVLEPCKTAGGQSGQSEQTSIRKAGRGVGKSQRDGEHKRHLSF